MPHFAAGARLALGVGPSVLLVAPDAGVTPQESTSVSALFFEAHLSRPFWFGRLALLPDLGARFFTRVRGVRIDAREQLVLRGLTPELGLGLAYRVD